MNEEVWWARIGSSDKNRVGIYESKSSAKGELWPIRNIPLTLWNELRGPLLRKNQIIAIRPLRIEVVKEGE